VKRVEALLESTNVVGYRVMLEVTQSLDPERVVFYGLRAANGPAIVCANAFLFLVRGVD
jgi:hypothetical protein